VPKRGQALISTGLAFAIPTGNYGRVAPRSGLAVKNSINVGAGVIDSDYRGEVKVLLFNHGDADFEISEGDRIAQLIIEKYTQTT
jgi:dUTP pyrophosphatase